MLGAKLSIAGLYNYDNSIFDGFRVPPNNVDINKSIIRQIIRKSDMQSCIYPHPTVLKDAIKDFCDLNYDRWDRIYQTTVYDYDPFKNYDMTETYKRTRTPNLTQTSKNAGTDTSKSYVKGFDSGIVQNGEAVAELGTSNTINNTGTENDEYTRITTGDASVRSTSQVVMEMRAERQYNFYSYVIDEFINEFCSCCYAI